MWKEFFKDNGNQGSMTRLIMFGTFIVSSIAVLYLAHNRLLTDTVFIAYIGAPAAAYGWGKQQDTKAAIATGSLQSQ